MAKMRIYQLAKELGIGNKELLGVIHDLGIEAKSHMSAVDDDSVAAITGAVTKGKKKPPAKKKPASARKSAPAKEAKTAKKAPATKGAKAAGKETAARATRKTAPAKAVKPAKKETAPKTARAAGKEPPAKAAKPAKKEAAPRTAPAEKKAAPPEPKPAKKPAPAKTAPATAPPAGPAVTKAPAPAPAPTKKKKKKDVKEPPPPPPEVPVIREPVLLSEGVSVKELAERSGLKVNEVIKKFLQKGKLVVVNQFLDYETASTFLTEMGIEHRKVSLEEEGRTEEELGTLSPRAPVVTIMGHVDHGKTSLLDAIRESSVAEIEKGGITQHIGAYHVELPKGSVVFLDTPGHEAFTAMRARGAKVTDIVVLVVAADDGVMPQTVEAIDHSKAAGVPIIVAVNKIDKPEARPDNVKTQLADHELIPEDWGGQTIFVDVSAKLKTGLEDLLEMILLQSEVMELQASPDKPCLGAVVEAKVDRGRGPVATILVQDGTLRVGDYFVTGTHIGKVRALLNEKGKTVPAAGPSTPVEVLGLSGVPGPGDSFQVVPDERKARQIASLREQKAAAPVTSRPPRVNLKDLFAKISDGVVKDLPIIVKGDVQGSVEALGDALRKLSTEKVTVNVIHRGVGTINEGDILLAAASNAVVIGFNVRPEPKVSELAAMEGVDMRFYNIIYKATEDIQKAMLGLLDPTFREEFQGRAEVRETFSVPKIGLIAGCGVLDGKITRSANVRVLRDGIVAYEGRIGSLRRFKDDVKEVASGYECGIGIEKFNDVKKGDIFETFIQVEEQPKL